jgi:hypothetical protein
VWGMRWFMAFTGDGAGDVKIDAVVGFVVLVDFGLVTECLGSDVMLYHPRVIIIMIIMSRALDWLRFTYVLRNRY